MTRQSFFKSVAAATAALFVNPLKADSRPIYKMANGHAYRIIAYPEIRVSVRYDAPIDDFKIVVFDRAIEFLPGQEDARGTHPIPEQILVAGTKWWRSLKNHKCEAALPEVVAELKQRGHQNVIIDPDRAKFLPFTYQDTPGFVIAPI